jgi:uncharacterized membrane protein (UPF0127 family)
MVFIVDQYKSNNGGFDEHKVMIGYHTSQEAKDAYLSNYQKGWKGFGDITALSLGEFKQWIKDGLTNKPIADQFAKWASGKALPSWQKAAAPTDAAKFVIEHWAKLKPWHGVDLDGTLATAGELEGNEYIGRPIRAMVDRVKRWLAKGEHVKIFTARVTGGKDAVKNIQDWCREYFGRILPVTNVKDPMMIDLWDDRAHRVSKNEGTKLAALTKVVPLSVVSVDGKPRGDLNVEVADTPETKSKGLSKRAALPNDRGMLFSCPGPFWMKDVNFPLDIIFLTKKGAVLEKMTMWPNHRLPDWALPRYRSKYAEVAYALEAPGGWCRKHGIAKGDRVLIDKAS